MALEKDEDVTTNPAGAGPNRKEFLRAAGVATAGAAVATAAPGLARASSARVVRDLAPVTVTISRGAVTTKNDWMGNVIARFEKANPEIKVKSLFAPQSSTDAHNQYVAQLSGGSSAVDIYQVDVIWPPEFAAAGWLLPVDKYITDSFKTDLLHGPRLGTTVNGKMYAIPYYTDVGMLFYRTDLLAKYKLAPPQTFTDMVAASQTIIKQEKGVPYGVLWQGAQYEGLFCDICELFWGNGGNILENFTGPKVVINSPQNQVALQFMVDTIHRYKIAPLAVTTYTEEETRHLFQNGKSLFLRNWPYVWPNGNDKTQSLIAGKFALKPMVHGPNGKPGAALGGWNMAINAKSQNPDAAAKVALGITNAESQKYLAINAGNNPSLASVYRDPEAIAANPYYKQYASVVSNALPRPVSKYETKISDRVTRQVHAALLGQVSVSAALANAQRDVEALVGGGNSTP